MYTMYEALARERTHEQAVSAAQQQEPVVPQLAANDFSELLK